MRGKTVGVNKRTKTRFLSELKEFASTLTDVVSSKGEWNIRGFVDVFKNVYALSTDTKLISKVLEIHLLPSFLAFADDIGYVVELPTHQNWYPDLTFVSKANPDIKFAVDLKTTYRLDERPDYCNGFTLGSHGAYFVDRLHCKNIQYPYSSYGGHFCLGVIYSRANISNEFETKPFPIDNIALIPAVIRNVVFFANEKWKIASDKSGSGNTANIGSVKRIDDVIRGNGVFAKAGEDLFDDYWINYGKIEVVKDGRRTKITSFSDYLNYRGLPSSLNNPKLESTRGE